MSLPNCDLASLNPELLPEGTAFRDATAVRFDCPACHSAGQPGHRLTMEFWRWKQTGADLAHLTFVDAVGEDNGRGGKFSTRSLRCYGPCHAHFNVTNGTIDHYGDSTSP